jgi:hypothetical protein
VTYPRARPYTDVRLTAVGGGVKEELVLRSANAPHSYLFPLRLTGLSATLAAGRIVLADAAGRPWAELPSGFMYDS